VSNQRSHSTAGLVSTWNGWVTDDGQVNHLGMKPASWVNSAFYPPWDGKMSISFLAE